MAKVTREKTMDVSAEALWNAITDLGQYPKFLDEVVSANYIEGEGTGSPVVEFELEIVKRFQYQLRFTMKDKTEMSWELASSNFFKVNSGRWHLTPKGDSSVHVTYEVEVGFGFFVPKWVTKKLTEVNLPKMFEVFEARAKSSVG